MSPQTLFLIARLTVAGLLYAFIGLVLYWLWRDFKSVGPMDHEAPGAELVLPETDQQFQVRASTEIGRAAGNLIQIDDETVSAMHARLLYQGGQWWIEDLASRNGTEVNGIPVVEPMVVTYGDEIRFGRVLGRLERVPAREAATEPETQDIA